VNKSILVVDDDPQVRRALARELKAEFKVLQAGTCAEALELLGSNPDICAVISDYNLGPGPTGADFLAQVRAIAPLVRRVMVSAQIEEEFRDAHIRDGLIHVFLEKPWSYGAVIAAARTSAPPATMAATNPAPTDLTVRIRRHRRFETTRTVGVRCTSWATAADLSAKDISYGGIFVRTPTPPQPETAVAIGMDASDGMRVWVDGRVAHALVSGHAAHLHLAPGFGVEFQNVTPRASAVVAGIVAATCAEAANRSADTRTQTELLLAEARALKATGRAADAAERYRRALDLDLGNVEAVCELRAIHDALRRQPAPR